MNNTMKIIPKIHSLVKLLSSASQADLTTQDAQNISLTYLLVPFYL